MLASLGFAAGRASEPALLKLAAERPKQAEQLRQLGCPWGQGFLFAKPMPVEELLDLLTEPAFRN